MEQQAFLAIAIFVITYGLIISEKIHRTILAMCGGLLMILLGIVDQDRAVGHIDFNTLGLLIGMMIIVSIMSETGMFRFLAVWAAKKVDGRPLALLIVFSLITAIGSSFLDNVTTVLLMVPVTFSIARELSIGPTPFLISEILMANIGGTATMIGDPPNVMIGSAIKQLSFNDFIVNLTPVVVIIFLVVLGLLVVIYRRNLKTTDEARARLARLDPFSEITDPGLLVKSLVVLILTITGFFMHGVLGAETATIALAGAFLLLLLTGENYLESSFEKVEWPTIFFFIGLFVLVGGLIDTGVIKQLSESLLQLTGGDRVGTSILILWMSAFASAFIDNIPFVATMIPLVEDMGRLGISNLEPLWWSLSLGACLGGNGMLIGASANLIVAGLSAKEGYPITFVRFMKIGLPLMCLSVTIAMIYIFLRYFI